MSSGKKDFFAKEVADAIKEACESFQVSQEKLDIEVVETGSMGIFGLIRKKAHIRVRVKPVSDPGEHVELEEAESDPGSFDAPAEESVEVEASEAAEPEQAVSKDEPAAEAAEEKPSVEKPLVEIRPESVEIIRLELDELLTLMGFQSKVTAELEGSTVRCRVSGEHEEALTGQEGKIIDSMQYLLRKIIARKVDEKVRLSIDVGEFREKRREELAARAKELAALVKEDGKTQSIPPLNPSERRIVHVALQGDKEIRSRSVGDGLFKKILIYKPGKGKKPASGKKGGSRGKRGKGSKPKARDNS